MEQFNLTNYLDEIRAISRNCGCTVTAAVDRMCVNLDTFNEYHQGTRTLNYHVIGHHWGALPAAQKVAQKKEAKRMVSQQDTRPIRGSRRRI